MNELWLIIWRFQPFHKWHKLLIDASQWDNSSSLVLIGSVNKQDTINPYSYELREKILQAEYNTKIFLWDLPDFSTDNEWKNYILTHIPQNTNKVTLYCGDKKNDSAVQSLLQFQDSLPFTLIIKEIPRSIIPVSATQIRNWIKENDTVNLKKYLSEKTLLFLGIQL